MSHVNAANVIVLNIQRSLRISEVKDWKVAKEPEFAKVEWKILLFAETRKEF